MIYTLKTMAMSDDLYVLLDAMNIHGFNPCKAASDVVFEYHKKTLERKDG